MFHPYSRLSRLSENIGCFGHLVHSRNFTYHPVPFVTVILLIYYSWTASGTAVYKYQMPARDKADDALCSLGCHYVLETCPLRLVWTSCGRNVPIDGVVRMNQMENKLPVTHCDSTIYVKFSSSEFWTSQLPSSFRSVVATNHQRLTISEDSILPSMTIPTNRELFLDEIRKSTDCIKSFDPGAQALTVFCWHVLSYASYLVFWSSIA